MKFSMIWISGLFLIGTLLTFTACSSDDDGNGAVLQDIVSFAENSEDYTILAEALKTVNLDGVLQSDGPFTVFAPDNSAFIALLESNPDWNSLEDIPANVLTAVLTNHVLGGEVRAADLQDAYYTTLSSTDFDGAVTTLYVNLDDGVTLNGNAAVVAPDVEVSNGVIHGIDAVIEMPTVVTFATSNPALSSLVAALTRDDLSTDFVAALSGDGPFTVFAPTNQAFQTLLNSNDEWNTLNDIPASLLETVLTYHVSGAGNVRSTDLMDGMEVPTLADESLTVNLGGESPVIEGGSSSATVLLADVQGVNGVVHVIDTVLLP